MVPNWNRLSETWKLKDAHVLCAGFTSPGIHWYYFGEDSIQSTRKHPCAKQITTTKPCVKARSFYICYFVLFLKQLCEIDVSQMRKKLWLKEIQQPSQLISGRDRIQFCVFKLLNHYFLHYPTPFQSKTVMNLSSHGRPSRMKY